ncbi:MAG: hypothetical protein IJF92_00700 [Bacilli bacterium]|nr:hypothetical protein [Bacilli bacterium]MBQ3307667.1 hypothetical protein [Bacilli bacterium]
MPEGKSKFNYKQWVDPVTESNDFPSKYNFHLVRDLDTLQQVLSQKSPAMGFDTETTGLNHEDIFMVGYSFCMDGKNAYYVPVKHSVEDLDLRISELEESMKDIDENTEDYINIRSKIEVLEKAKFSRQLGEPAIDMIYEKMKNTPIVFMFNMRYDVRVMEFHGFKELMEKIDASEQYTEEQKILLKSKVLEKQYMKYDMSEVNTIDVQAMVFDVDTNNKFPSLKKSEQYFLGWRGDSFEETLGDAANFYQLDPEKAYFYAATDALGTLLLGYKLMPFLKAAKKSGELDVKCLQPLTRFENEMTEVDVEKLKNYSKDLTEQIEACQHRCWEMAGEEFNLGSPTDNNRVLTKLNIHTGVTTSRGMSTSKVAIEGCLKTLSKDDPARQLLKDLVDYASLSKQRSSYVDNVIEMCKRVTNHPNRLRFRYKNTEVPSGRFAAGGDKKNAFFSDLNIQNITKPHVTMHYVVKFEDIKEAYPDVYEAILNSGTREECDTDLVYTEEQLSEIAKTTGEVKAQEIVDKIKGQTFKRHSYKILDWVFSNYPWFINGIDETEVEGFDSYLNIRAAFLPDPNHYWVSIDFNAEELRIPTLITKEPVWLDAFKHNKDIHKQTALAIWGEENYDKNKRKIAKSANFGILYGQTGRNFADRFNMTIDEGNQFVEDFKASLPVLFRWVNIWEKVGEKQGYVTTLFGRPIRVRSYFESGEWKWKSYAKRMCVNGTIQGTGADIMKYCLIKVFQKFYKTNRTNEVRFKNMIHDEINYQMRKDKLFDLLPEVMDIMRVQRPDWEFPMEVGLEMGNRWGQSVPFRFKIEKVEGATSKISGVEPKTDPVDKKTICNTFKVSEEDNVEEEASEEVEEKVKFTWEEEKYE